MAPAIPFKKDRIKLKPLIIPPMNKILFLIVLATTLFSCQKEKTEAVKQMEQRFFGTICVNPVDYEGSVYENQPDHLKADMPAIFKVIAFNNGVAVSDSPFRNYDWYGVGAPICVKYQDDPGLTGEVFTFEIWVWVKAVDGFTYQLYHTFSVTDDQLIERGGDDIVDFAVGTCAPGSDHEWNWLDPPSGGTFNLIINP